MIYFFHFFRNVYVLPDPRNRGSFSFSFFFFFFFFFLWLLFKRFRKETSMKSDVTFWIPVLFVYFPELIYWASMDSGTLNTGAHLDLSGQRIAVCSAFIFCGVQFYESVLQKTVFVTQYPFTNEHQMLPLSSMGTCQVVVVPESLSLACSIWWNNQNHFKEYLSGIHWHVCFWK